jgi:eukaryotic-like serine/threonine-protein kinase
MLRLEMGSATPRPGFPSSTPPVRLIGRYLLCDMIAAGGMATVHLGRLVGAEGFSRTVAIKQLHQHFARSQEFVTMFLDEARILSRIRHPHVVAPLDVIVLEGELFIVMEYVHGASLAELLDESGGPIPPRIASAIIGQMLLGLHAAHDATSEGGEPLSIVHRDISPHNVLVGGDGIARVVDFGIAKAESRARTTGDGSLKGKLGYMAPEQLRSRPVDRRTDLFTCGTVLWEALTGERLYAADNLPALFHKLENTTIRWPSELVPGLPRELDNVLRRALALDPAERVATAREMALELERAVVPASTLETSEWVDGLVGPLLRSRAQRISELESVDIGTLTLSRSPSTPPARLQAKGTLESPALAATVAIADQTRTEAVGLNVTAAMPLMLEKPLMSDGRGETSLGPATITAAILQPTPPALSAVPISSDVGNMESEIPAARKGRRFTRALLFAVPLVCCAAAAGSYLDRASQTPASESRLQVSAPQPSAVASVHSEDAATRIAPLQTPPRDPPRALSAEVPLIQARSAGSAPLSASAPRKTKPGNESRSTRVAPSSSGAVPSATTAPGVRSASPRSSGLQRKCTVPYTVDEHGVKRFKPECF